jgi:hypothetical protein
MAEVCVKSKGEEENTLRPGRNPEATKPLASLGIMVITLQAWTGSEASRWLRLTDFKTIAQ